MSTDTLEIFTYKEKGSIFIFYLWPHLITNSKAKQEVQPLIADKIKVNLQTFNNWQKVGEIRFFFCFTELGLCLVASRSSCYLSPKEGNTGFEKGGLRCWSDTEGKVWSLLHWQGRK